MRSTGLTLRSKISDLPMGGDSRLKHRVHARGLRSWTYGRDGDRNRQRAASL